MNNVAFALDLTTHSLSKEASGGLILQWVKIDLRLQIKPKRIKIEQIIFWDSFYALTPADTHNRYFYDI